MRSVRVPHSVREVFMLTESEIRCFEQDPYPWEGMHAEYRIDVGVNRDNDSCESLASQAVEKDGD